MLTSVILIVSICVSIIYLISNYRKQLRFFQMANALPGPKTHPIIGNAYYLLQRNFDEFLNSICLLVDTYPSPSRFWLGNKLFILISEPDQIKTILESPSCLNKGIIYKPIRAVLGNGLITAPGEISQKRFACKSYIYDMEKIHNHRAFRDIDHVWVRHRKMILPSFNTNMLRVFCDTFVKRTSIVMEKLEYMVNCEVDLSQHLVMYTLDNIFGTLFKSTIELESQKKELINVITRLREIMTQRIQNIFLFPDIIFNVTSLGREQQKHLNFIHSVAEEIIQQQENVRNNLDGNKNQSVKPSTKVFLDKLMEVSEEDKKFTREEIIQEIFTIVITGFDTIATTLNFTMFMLASYPELQQKVYEELLEIYGTQDPNSMPVKFGDLQHMIYLENVIKETLRLFPIAPIIVRRLNEDIQIGKYTLPKDAEVGVAILSLHRNEKYWPKALIFDPDRFLSENMTNIYPYSYIPFSNGPRNCIGGRYAMTSMKVFIATLLRTYILKVDKRVKIEEIKLMMNPVLTPVNPVKFRIEKRI